MFGLKKKKVNKNSREAYRNVLPRVPVSRERVLKTIHKLQPCHYIQISHDLHIIEGSVTPRIAELRRLRLIRVELVGPGAFGTKVNYYSLTKKGRETLSEIYDSERKA